MAQSHAEVAEISGGIRAAVSQGAGHAPQQFVVYGCGPIEVHDAAYSAHGVRSPPSRQRMNSPPDFHRMQAEGRPPSDSKTEQPSSMNRDALIANSCRSPFECRRSQKNSPRIWHPDTLVSCSG